MSIDDKERPFPRSMRQQQILDAAAAEPDASFAELASMVPSASADLVEQVLEEYGDPASDETAEGTTPSDPAPKADGGTTGSTESADHPVEAEAEAPESDDGESPADSAGTEPDEEPAAESEGDNYPTSEELTQKQRDVLAAVAATPEATQQEIGERLDVSAATVSNRVNSIAGFDWSDRESFVDAVLDEPSTADVLMDGGTANEQESATADEPEATESVAEETTDRMADIEESLGRIEQRLAEMEGSDDGGPGGGSVLADPDLVHKVVHACLESDSISESEELRILDGLLG